MVFPQRRLSRVADSPAFFLGDWENAPESGTIRQVAVKRHAVN
jgi:hypothetical protein